MGLEEAVFKLMEETLAPQLDLVPDEHLIQVVHNLTDSLIEKNKLNEETQCDKQECSFCCYDDILITPLEAEYIKKAGVTPNISLQTLQQNSHNFRQLSFKNKACIFLKEGKCSIYSHRPMVCKLHNISKSQSPEQCVVDETGHTATVNQQVYLVETQSLMYYVVGRETEELKSIYKYEW